MTDTTRMESVRQVLQRHREDILRNYQAIGVGIGKQNPTDTSYVITVYLESASHQTNEPITIDGVPLKFEVTGPIRPLN